jgi:hypothetical protein
VIDNACPELGDIALPPPVVAPQPANKAITNNVITLEIIFINSSQKIDETLMNIILLLDETL